LILNAPREGKEGQGEIKTDNSNAEDNLDLNDKSRLSWPVIGRS